MNDNQRIGARIRQARKEMRLSQEDVGKHYGSTTAFISQLECGSGVGIGTIQKLSKILGKPVSWFLEESGDIPVRPIKSIISDFELATSQLKALLIPILGSIPAGYPFTEEESVIDYLTIPKDMFNTDTPGEKVFALRVSGDSLQEDGIISPATWSCSILMLRFRTAKFTHYASVTKLCCVTFIVKPNVFVWKPPTLNTLPCSSMRLKYWGRCWYHCVNTEHPHPSLIKPRQTLIITGTN
jgi:transcriptional regulator with XRE-family HTH domain